MEHMEVAAVGVSVVQKIRMDRGVGLHADHVARVVGGQREAARGGPIPVRLGLG